MYYLQIAIAVLSHVLPRASLNQFGEDRLPIWSHGQFVDVFRVRQRCNNASAFPKSLAKSTGDSLCCRVMMSHDVNSLSVCKLIDQFILDMRADQRNRNISLLDEHQPVRWAFGDEYLI